MKQFKRYEKQVPGHRIQVNIKFLFFKKNLGATIKHFQYTAINDATCARALKIYDKRNQACTIDFMGYVTEHFLLRIYIVQTDNSHKDL